MSAPHSPPPGSMPSGMMSPDMQSTLAQMTAGSGKSGQAPNPMAGMGNAPASQSTKPQRPVGSLPQEAKYFSEDVADGILSILPDFMQQILGIKDTDTPEEKNRKREMLRRYNELTADQQQVVQQQMKEQHEKQQKLEEERLKKEQEAKQKAQQDELPVPQGKTRGEGLPGMSSKKRTTLKLQSDRKKMSSAG